MNLIINKIKYTYCIIIIISTKDKILNPHFLIIFQKITMNILLNEMVNLENKYIKIYKLLFLIILFIFFLKNVHAFLNDSL